MRQPVLPRSPVRPVSRRQLSWSQSLPSSLSLLSEVPREEGALVPRRCSGSAGTTGAAARPCAASCCRPCAGLATASDWFANLHFNMDGGGHTNFAEACGPEDGHWLSLHPRPQGRQRRCRRCQLPHSSDLVFAIAHTWPSPSQVRQPAAQSLPSCWMLVCWSSSPFGVVVAGSQRSFKSGR